MAALVWCLAAVTPGAHGGEATPDTAAAEEDRPAWFFSQIINPAHSAERRESALQLVIREADEGGRAAARLLGRLYFMGESHPAKPVSRDLERAEHYLQIAMASGDLESMLWLAEVELANRRPLEAAIWAQSYIQLRTHADETEDGTGYVPSLLARIGRARGGPRIDEEVLAEYVAGFVQTHGDRLREAAAGPDHRGTGWAKVWYDIDRAECNVTERLSVDTTLNDSRRTPGALRFRMNRPLNDSGLAHYLLRIKPDGSVSNAMLFSSIPDAEYGRQGKQVALSATFNQVPSDCRARWLLTSLNFVNPAIRLR